MTSTEIRQKFINFFESKGHAVLPSASLLPENDSSVLFTTAGMQQFKKYYINPSDSKNARVATIQPCIRTSDIDEVGDASHLTFFEMLGNFSFGYPEKSGSYFKKEAIQFAWEFLTDELKIDPSRVSTTYFKDDTTDIEEDKESLKILQNIEGLKTIKSQGFADNFWSLGTEGSPGGPTVEFYVDNLEVWNLVFNQYILSDGEYIPSKYQGVDTGMGLERLAMIMQGKETVFEIDELSNLKSQISNLKITSQNIKLEDLRIILDHLRASEALAKEGLLPSNKTQGFVLRRLIRRMIVVLKKYQINIDQITNNQIILVEAEKFNLTLDRGLNQFNLLISGKKINGREAFDLFQSYGFPFELIRELARERGVTIDEKEYQTEFAKHQEKSRAASVGMFKGGLADNQIETTKLHTVAHLLLSALKQVLGDSIEQKGSNITSERLRFDFNYPEKLSTDQISHIEKIVNDNIKLNLPVTMEEMNIEEAKKSGAHGTFNDKYGNKVKVYTIGTNDPSTSSGQVVSREICGGPHVKNTSELGKFKIIKEESSSAGVRRIRAITT